MTDWDRTYESLKRWNWFILLILSSASYFLMSHSMTFGIILGGFITFVNFGFLQSTIRKSFSPDGNPKTKKYSLMIKSFFRLLILGVIIYFLITRGLINPVGLTIGLSIVVLSIVSYGISRTMKSGIGGVA